MFFFLLRSVGRRHGARAKKKKHHPGKGRGRRSPVGRRHGASPSPAFPRSRKKKNTTQGGVFFFLLRPRADAHSLTAGLGGDASPSPGWCFFFFCCGPARTGVVFFFFCCGPARMLTHSLWAGAISARPGWCFFFLLRPRRVFLDNNKKCLGYYIGSKKTRRGHSKKKKKTPLPPDIDAIVYQLRVYKFLTEGRN